MTAGAYVSPAIAKHCAALARARARRDTREIGAAIVEIRAARTKALRREVRAMKAARRATMRSDGKSTGGQMSFRLAAAE